MTHPYFDAAAFPWFRAEAQRLHMVLVRAAPHPQAIDGLYQRCAPDLPPLALNEAPIYIWQSALNNLTAAGALRALIDIVRAEYPLNLEIQTVLAAITIADEALPSAPATPMFSCIQ